MPPGEHNRGILQGPPGIADEEFAVLETGRAPHFTELAGTLSLTPDETRALLPEAAAAGVGCWISISHDTDYIASWAPFSNIPTQYLVSVDGEQKWYGQ